MNIAAIQSEIAKLDLGEQLQLLEQVWDSISSRQAELPVPEWQKTELDTRRNELEQGKQSLHDCDEVHADLRKRFQRGQGIPTGQRPILNKPRNGMNKGVKAWGLSFSMLSSFR